MELRIPTLEELKRVYAADYREAFPPAEQKSLTKLQRMWEAGQYRPYCLFDGDQIIGGAFLWLAHPGWALLDYLFVTASRRNERLGPVILRELRRAEGPDTVIFGEVEVPEDAPDPAMAERRLGFYARNGWRQAGYETKVFGVHFKTIYLADREVADEELMPEHRFVYQNSFPEKTYARKIRIPYDASRARRGSTGTAGE